VSQLSLQDLAAIAGASNGASTAALARQLGQPYITVAVAAWRMRRAGGWYCRLEWRPCLGCGQLLACGPNRPQRHPACRRARLVERRRAWLELPQVRARRQQRSAHYWAGLPAERRAAKTAQDLASIRREQAITRERATNRGAPWTPEEDRYLLTHWPQPAREQAFALGRTLWSVRRRRWQLARS